jgi:superfamily II DNA or RNA helicase
MFERNLRSERDRLLFEALAKLSKTELQGVAQRLGVKIGGGKSELIDRIANATFSDARAVASAARRTDLLTILDGLVMGVGVSEFVVLPSSTSRKPELEEGFVRLFGARPWIPNEDADCVPGTSIPVGHALPSEGDDIDDVGTAGRVRFPAPGESTDGAALTFPAPESPHEESDDNYLRRARDAVEVIPCVSTEATLRAPHTHQKEALSSLESHFIARRKRQGVLCLPTGGGKTFTTLTFLLSHYTRRGKRVLWVTHRTELLEQAIGELRNTAPLLNRTQPIRASRLYGKHSNTSGDFVFASSQSLVRNMKKNSALTSAFDIVVLDEAHRATSKEAWKRIERFIAADKPVLSLTATPFRLQNGEQVDLRAQLGEVVYEISLRELMRRGRLASPEFHRISVESRRALAKVEATLASFRPRDENDDLPSNVIKSIADAKERTEQIVSYWHKNQTVYGKTLVFACDQNHAQSLANEFKLRGKKPVRIIHSNVNKDVRREQIDGFRGAKSSEPTILINVGILTEGFDDPSIRTVLLARPTTSTSLYMQMIGRGMRSNTGKSRFFVLDFVDGLEQHGFHLAGAKVAMEMAAALAGASESEHRVDEVSSRKASRRWTAADLERMFAGFRHRRSRSLECDMMSVQYELAAGNMSFAHLVFAEDFTSFESFLKAANQLPTQPSRAYDIAKAGQELVTDGRLTGIVLVDVLSRESFVGIELELRPISENLSSALREGAKCLLEANQQEALADFAANWSVHSELHGAFPGLSGPHDFVAALRVALVDPIAVDDVPLDASEAKNDLAADPPANQVDRTPAMRQFTTLAQVLAHSDGHAAEAEHIAFEFAFREVFGCAPETGLAGEAPRGWEASFGLQELDRESRLKAFDALWHVARADGVVTTEERIALADIGRLLGLDQDDIDEREAAATEFFASIDGGNRQMCSHCRKTMPDPDPRFCGHCGSPMRRDPLGTDAGAASSMETTQPNSREAVRLVLPDAKRRNEGDSWAERAALGRRAEEWLADALRNSADQVGGTLYRRVRDDSKRESDLVIVLKNEPLNPVHIEVKAVTTRDINKQVYWSQLEAEKAQILKHQGTPYWLVLVVLDRPDRNLEPVAHWFDDPLDQLDGCERDTEWQVRYVGGAKPLATALNFDITTHDRRSPLPVPRAVHRITIDPHTLSKGKRATPTEWWREHVER